jgi:hypothetical protein
MKKYLSIVLILSMIVIIGATTSTGSASHEEFKNLKVLPGDISEQKLDSVMASWSISLGVKCNFCHVMNADTTIKRFDFASDANKHKDIARHMYKMTAEINDKFFNSVHSTQPDTIHAVVCYTCHRGKKEPDAKAFISLIDSTIQSNRSKH